MHACVHAAHCPRAAPIIHRCDALVRSFRETPDGKSTARIVGDFDSAPEAVLQAYRALKAWESEELARYSIFAPVPHAIAYWFRV